MINVNIYPRPMNLDPDWLGLPWWVFIKVWPSVEPANQRSPVYHLEIDDLSVPGEVAVEFLGKLWFKNDEGMLQGKLGILPAEVSLTQAFLGRIPLTEVAAMINEKNKVAIVGIAEGSDKINMELHVQEPRSPFSKHYLLFGWNEPAAVLRHTFWKRTYEHINVLYGTSVDSDGVELGPTLMLMRRS